MKKAIVIGAGFGGLASAIRLRKKGYNVEILDRCNNLGGRAQFLNLNGFKHDMGPTLITAPFLFKELFELFNKNINNYVKLVPLKTWYRFIFEDGSYLDYDKSLKQTIANIRKINEHDAINYPKMIDASKLIYDLAFTKLADQPFHQLSYMFKQIPSLIKFKSYNSVFQFVSKYMQDDKLRRAFSIPPLLVGGNPFTTTCIYSLITYLERKHGVFFAMGGTGKIVNALSKLINEIGIKVSLNTTIESIELKDSNISQIIDNNGNIRKADLYVSNIDPLYLYTHLIKKKFNITTFLKTKLSRKSMGLFVLFFGTKKKYSLVKHHTIIFGKEYKKLLDKIFHKKELPADLSIYLHRPTATDLTFAPRGCDSFYALVPVPNLDSKINWIKESNSFQQLIISILSKRLLKDLESNIVNPYYMSPLDFKKSYLSYQGSGFSIAPYFTQSAWFRFHNKSEIIKNLFLVGAGTHPGAGIPGVLSSAKVIERLV